MQTTLKKRVLLTFVHGLAIMVVLAVWQLLLLFWEKGFFLYNPPIGFALFVVVSYVIQPLIVGGLDVFVLTWLFRLEGCQTGAWLNGLFLLLAFTSINVVLQTVWGIGFSVQVAVVEVVLLAFPFGLLGKITRIGFREPKEKPDVA